MHALVVFILNMSVNLFEQTVFLMVWFFLLREKKEEPILFLSLENNQVCGLDTSMHLLVGYQE